MADKQQNVQFSDHVIAASVSGFASVAVTHRLDVVTKRAQMQDASVNSLSIFANIVRTAGIRGLYRGLKSNLPTTGIDRATSYTLYSFLLTSYNKHVDAKAVAHESEVVRSYRRC